MEGARHVIGVETEQCCRGLRWSNVSSCTGRGCYTKTSIERQTILNLECVESGERVAERRRHKGKRERKREREEKEGDRPLFGA